MKLNKSFLPKYFVVSILFISTIILLAASCKKNEDDPKKPVITTVGDGSGEAGDTLIIAGENFNDAGEKTTVFFGTANAKILTGTKTTIKVIVPNLLPSTVKVKAEVNELESNAVDFIVEKEKTEPVEPMEFDDFEPKSGKFEKEINISGKNFTDNVEVYVNNKRQTPIVVNSEGTKITFQLASQTYSGEVMIKRGAEELTHEDLMDYELSYDINELASFGATDIIMLDDGSYYLIHSYRLIKVGADNTMSDTIIKFDVTRNIRRLFLDKNDILYISDHFGKIFTYNEITGIVDSIQSNHPELLESIVGITGDNHGFLYACSESNYGIIKINILSGETTEIVNTTDDEVVGITYVSDTLYATSEKGLFKVHIDGGEPEYIVSNEEFSFPKSDICQHKSGDFLIVDSHSENGGLFRMNYKNELNKEIDEIFRGIYINEDGLTYVVTSGRIIQLIIN